MLNDVLPGMTGKLKIEINGQVVAEVDNLVVTAGKAFVASRMAGAAAAVIGWMAIGTTNMAPSAGDTALAAEAARVAIISGNASTNTVVYTATFPAGTGTGAIVEAGLFNANVAGTMLARTVFSVINKGASDSMTITWTVTVS